MTFQKGDEIEITCEGRILDGVIVLASANNDALAISFEAIIGMHAGTMPLIRQDGIYRSLIDGTEVVIRKKQNA